MVQELPQRTGFSGPKLIRLLARMTDADVPESRQSLSDRLSLWLGWTDAIALASALNRAPPVVPAIARAPGDAEEQECARVRTMLEDAITGINATAPSRHRGQMRVPGQGEARVAPVVEYSTYRQRYTSLQQTMESSIGNLRGRLRTLLASATPEMTRLAVVDTVMEQALGARERSLLAAVPKLLAVHFERLRQIEQTALADAQASETPSGVVPGVWLDVFRKDMQSVLLAELDIRFQPIEGLLAALRAC